MEFATLKVDVKEEMKVMEITIHRPEAMNAINLQLIKDLNAALDVAERNEEIRTVVIRGNDHFFCTGMDFKEAMSGPIELEKEKIFATGYCHTLKRFATISKTIVSICEGKVMAGGVGFAAASDIVIANSNAVFTLSELIWGLLPANVLPYLIRRSGFQASYFMTLTTNKMASKDAKEMHLVDILSDNPQKEFTKLNQRLSIIHPQTIGRMKSYFRQLWIINEEMEQLAINTLADLKMDPLVQKNIKNYVDHGKLPWE